MSIIYLILRRKIFCVLKIKSNPIFPDIPKISILLIFMSNTVAKRCVSGSNLVNMNQETCGLVKVRRNSTGSAFIIFLLFDKSMHFISYIYFLFLNEHSECFP